MTKAELLIELSTEYDRVYELRTTQQEDGIKKILIAAYKIYPNDNLRRFEIWIFVENEGQPNETAYWIGKKPSSPVFSDFRIEVNNYIKAKIDSGIIKGGFGTMMDESKEIAYGIAIIDVAGEYKEKKIFIWKEGGNLTHKVVT